MKIDESLELVNRPYEHSQNSTADFLNISRGYVQLKNIYNLKTSTRDQGNRVQIVKKSRILAALN